MYLLAPFIMPNLLKESQSYEDKHHFRDQNGPFVLNKNFLVQTIVITFIYLLALFIVQNLKKILQWIQNYDDAAFFDLKWSICFKQFFFEKCLLSFSSTQQSKFLDPKWLISPNQNFFRQSLYEPCFFHSCLSSREILIYQWNTDDQKILKSLRTRFQACSFCRMLMNHENFDFTQTSDKLMT